VLNPLPDFQAGVCSTPFATAVMPRSATPSTGRPRGSSLPWKTLRGNYTRMHLSKNRKARERKQIRKRLRYLLALFRQMTIAP